MMKNTELEKAIAEFIGTFEIMFRYDWQYTKKMIANRKDETSFIEFGLENEIDHWEEFGALFNKYCQLVAIMQQNGLEPRFPIPLEALPDFKERVW